VRVKQLALEDFRNYEREQIELVAGLNLVAGRNAQGKTNLLEAIHCLSGFGSPRAADSALVREGTERALLHAEIQRGERKVRVDLEIKPGRGTRALINRSAVSGLRSLSEVVVSVFFGPDELSLVKGSPDGRRRFLDELVVKLRPARDSLRREFERVLKQRNALLKSAPRKTTTQVEETLAVWDETLARTGAALASARLEALAALVPFARKRYESIAGSGRLELTYMSEWLPEEISGDVVGQLAPVDQSSLQDALTTKIESVRAREIERGVSLAGPQRDDIAVSLEDTDQGLMLDARAYASQGDQRTAALALKLGEHDLLSDALDDEPILLLDDVFSELDPSRRAWLVEAIADIAQAIVTSADIDRVGDVGASRVIDVTSGHARIRDHG
jgi:DNA replication and repair protein RecF